MVTFVLAEGDPRIPANNHTDSKGLTADGEAVLARKRGHAAVEGC
jgi:hypothetical protein